MKYPLAIRNEKIGNLDLRVVGVIHGPNYFKQHKEFFETEVTRPNHLLFEANGLEENGFYQKLAGCVEGQGRSIFVPDSGHFGHQLNDIVAAAVGGLLLFKSQNKVVSRRDFVKKGFMALGGLFLSTGYFGLREDALQKLVGPDSTLDNKIAYNAVQDFRNIISADNICRIERDCGIIGTATYFIGHYHINGLSAYINNPTLRKKRILYFPQELLL